MKKIKITVYTTSHNYGKYLQEAIESVLRQTVDSWELLLIDDNSTDNTKGIMELYKMDPRIKIFDTPGIGLAAVANFSMKHARGEYIMRLDADDVLDDNILLVLSNYLDRYPNVAMVFPDYFLVDDHGGIIRHEGRETIYQNNHLLDMPANGACTLIRKGILEKVGGYREDTGAQDGFDLWIKILRDYKCANINVPLFYYRRHGENLTENYTRILNARRAIKKDASMINLDKFRPIIGVIPCRRRYDIYPNLWSKKLKNKTLLDTAVENCLASTIFDMVVVTSDNLDTQRHISKYHDSRLRFIERSREHTTYSSSIVPTLEHIIHMLGIGYSGTTVLSYIQAPFTTTPTLEEAVYTMVMNNTDSAFAVEEVQEYLYRRTPHGLIPLNPQEKLRSDFDIIYSSAPTSTAVQNINFKNGSLAGAKIAYFIIPREETFFIRTKRDYEIARLLKRKTRLSDIK